MKHLFILFFIVATTNFSHAQDLATEGRRLLSEGNPLAASQKFADAAKINPFDASALNNQAVALAAQGDVEKALSLLERANKLSPNRSDILANLTELRNWMNRNTPQIVLAKPSQNLPAQAQMPDLLPEPPPLWKK